MWVVDQLLSIFFKILLFAFFIFKSPLHSLPTTFAQLIAAFLYGFLLFVMYILILKAASRSAK